jgi:hypothetical protein
MSHPAQIFFVSSVKEMFPEMFVRKQVLEVGSLDINGSIRDLFEQCTYIGVDLGEGKGVDLIARGEDLVFEDKCFDVVASCECFEHNPKWVETFNNMVRMSSKLVFFSCATTGRAEHGTARTNPWDSPFTAHDYYKNLTEQDFRDHCDLSQFEEYAFSTDDDAHDLYFWGIKKTEQ